MMKMDYRTAPQTFSRRQTLGGDFLPGLRLFGHTLSLAADIGALEECLALERASGMLAPPSEGIHSPPAVPFCEFLMLRSGDGRLQAVSRLMRLDGGNPIGNPLASGRFHLSPLLTALRYSREGILEMGVPAFTPDCDLSKGASLLWSGMIRYLERNGLGFVIGMESLSMAMERAHAWPRLMESHGLPPELQVETRSAWNPRGFQESGSMRNGSPSAAEVPATDYAWSHLPAGFQEALRRGCRLACEPAFNAAAGCLEFVWVASRDMLQSGDSRGWRGAQKP